MQLQERGYKVYTQAVSTAAGTALRVYVGPKLDRAVLQQAQGKIDKQFKLNSMIVRFAP